MQSTVNGVNGSYYEYTGQAAFAPYCVGVALLGPDGVRLDYYSAADCSDPGGPARATPLQPYWGPGDTPVPPGPQDCAAWLNTSGRERADSLHSPHQNSNTIIGHNLRAQESANNPTTKDGPIPWGCRGIGWVQNSNVGPEAFPIVSIVNFVYHLLQYTIPK
jgi:hypothetical protein